MSTNKVSEWKPPDNGERGKRPDEMQKKHRHTHTHSQAESKQKQGRKGVGNICEEDLAPKRHSAAEKNITEAQARR